MQLINPKSRIKFNSGQSVHRASKGLMKVAFFSLMVDIWMLDLLFFKQNINSIHIPFHVEYASYILNM